MEKLWRKKTALVFSFVGYFIMNLYWFLCTCMYVEQIVIKNVSQEHMRPVFVYFLSECTSIYGYEYKKSEMFRKLNDHSINIFCLKNDDPWNPFLDKQHLIEWEALLILIFFLIRSSFVSFLNTKESSCLKWSFSFSFSGIIPLYDRKWSLFLLCKEVCMTIFRKIDNIL